MSLPIPGPMPYTDEWFAWRKYDPSRSERKVVFGASDAAALLGVSPYRTKLDLYLDKRMGRTIEDNDAMRMGRKLEPIILDEYTFKTGVEIVTGLPMYFSADNEFLAYTPDALSVDERIVVDAKATTARRYRANDAGDTQFGEDGSDQMPLEYVVQSQQQMMIAGTSNADYPVLFDGRTLRVYSIKRNDDLCKAIDSAATDMAHRIINGRPPDPDYSHENTREALFLLNEMAPGLVVTLSEQVEEMWIQRDDIAEQIKELEARKEELTNRCVEAIGSAEVGVFPSATAQLKRINVKGCSYTVDRKPYSYVRRVKCGY